jgi:hypothetical protein
MRYGRIIPLALATLVNLTALQAKTYTIGNGGNFKWNGNTGDNCGCPDSGGNCTVSNSVAQLNVQDHGATWFVSGVLDLNHADITLGDGSIFAKDMALGRYTFPSGYFETLEGEFQNIPGGTRINLAGVTTDDAGRFAAEVQK